MPDIRILKLIAKDNVASPQTLLVVGTAVDRDDVWVCFDNVDPTTPPPPSVKSTKSARAVRVDLDAIPTTKDNRGQVTRDATYDVELTLGQWVWVARFDLPDRADLSDLWQRFVQQAPPDAAPTIPLRAWHTRPEPPWEVAVAKNVERDFVPVGPPPVERRFAKTEIETLPLFELGVLLVHGIGKHEVRETLIRFGEPFVLFWERWLRAVTGLLVSRRSMTECTGLSDRLDTGIWRGKQDNDRDIPALRRPSKARVPADSITGATPVKPPGWACGMVRIEDTIFKTPGSETPSSTLARLSVVGTDGELRQSHVLLSEAWWTGETFYPSFAELFVWITQALPVALRMQAAGVLRSSRADVMHSWDQCKVRPLGVTRVLVDVMLLIMKYVLLVPFLVVAFALGQIGLLALLLLSLVPFDAVRGRIRGAVDLLLGTVGQSYALKTSSVRRNAIVRAVIRDLEFMTGKCQRVAVVSHSQGAEVARLVFQTQRWPGVWRWVTFGAGIVPLAMLDEDRDDETLRRWAAALLQLCSTVIAVIAIVALADAYFESRLPWLHQAADWSRSYGWALGVGAGLVLVRMLWRSPPPWRSDFSRAMFPRWHNYYASHDPVPGGPIQENPTPAGGEPIQDTPTLAKDAPIYNTRFGLSDHTSYFDNTEQFVAPIALDLFELAGLGKCVDAAAPALTEAAERRDIYTWWRMVLRIAALLAFIGIVVSTAYHDSGARSTEWARTVSAAWGSADGWAVWGALWNSGIIGSLAIDLWAAWALALAYFLLRPTWSWWWAMRSRDRLFNALADVLTVGGSDAVNRADAVQ